MFLNLGGPMFEHAKELAGEGVEAAETAAGAARRAVNRARIGASPGTRAFERVERLNGERRLADRALDGAERASGLATAVDRGLALVNAGATGVDQYAESSAQTEAGAQWDGVLAGALNYGGSMLSTGARIGKLKAGTGVVGAADAVVGMGLEKLGVKKSSLGDMDNTAVHAVTAMGEDLATGDTRASGDFHERSKQGEYGPVFREASKAGDFWADRGLAGGMSDLWHAFAD